MPKVRPEKVNSLLKRQLSEYILEEGYEGIQGLFTITAVESTADLEHAKVFFSVVGQGENEVLEILERHLYDIQGMLYQKLQMKKIPRVSFVPDSSGKYADHIGKLLQGMKNGE